ncbi:glycerol-3-phosphate dehydrogenase [Thermosipho affectus]|uniref:Glycerol-3-phosphate dehydrogenase [NAD(P)+] n=1 Tax=Thermosipho affectus TaxID=660294 RepID=A0ABX3IJL6_9BACT|nr:MULTISPECIES: NAD(P)H-dependent glycerol-3-phosphate dehydrogenase [Thermosipho]ANQ53005.1 glycerol-3-phosphate dehydrogenase [Thermosipho sp. 1070]APT71452.1 glycerol-3-phosphate dehydrogenase [Thermosipho sp. 1063]ONN28036.1 glycerol-3-phosphate dehydrogenase [Thermosipho affectus]OOC45526.1 glycerol-3-phosphate dehydrogenase [Thermosipho sp. 1074]
MKFGVIGAGSWGCAFANLLVDNGQDVLVWARRKEVVFEINVLKKISYLNGIRPKFNASDNIQEVVDFSDYLVIAIPVQFIRENLSKIKYWDNVKGIVNLSKGLEIKTLKRVSEIIRDFVSIPYTVLSGPSHAEEVAENIPTAVTIAGENVEELQILFSNDYFRVYTSDDVVGIEISGALKNVMAIAAGVLDGLGGWDNSKAALMTRALYEMIKFGKIFGAQEKTFFGLSGVGDLMVTCNSRHSRNRLLGELIAKGQTLEEVMKNTKMVAEGMYTVKAVVELSLKRGIDMPISSEVFKILYANKNPRLSMLDLMRRPLKEEWYI